MSVSATVLDIYRQIRDIAFFFVSGGRGREGGGGRRGRQGWMGKVCWGGGREGHRGALPELRIAY